MREKEESMNTELNRKESRLREKLNIKSTLKRNKRKEGEDKIERKTLVLSMSNGLNKKESIEKLDLSKPEKSKLDITQGKKSSLKPLDLREKSDLSNTDSNKLKLEKSIT